MLVAKTPSWGPAVARAVAEVALTGITSVVDTADLGLDRFDASGPQ
jgi:hypothetical protein